MALKIENDFQQKIMQQYFDEPFVIANSKDVLKWRTEWMNALKMWHSPYKALIDCTNLDIKSDVESNKRDLERMVKFFEGFYLKKVVGFGYDVGKGHDLLPFPVYKTEEEGCKEIGIRTALQKPAAGDFRSNIQIQNHFKQHSMEITFNESVAIDSKEKLQQFRDKITNNLRQWHSKWNLLIDCSNLEMTQEVGEDFKSMVRYFSGLFLKKVVGYSPKGDKSQYPFEVYRVRHKAAAVLEAEGAFSGDEADCVSRK